MGFGILGFSFKGRAGEASRHVDSLAFLQIKKEGKRSIGLILFGF